MKLIMGIRQIELIVRFAIPFIVLCIILLATNITLRPEAHKNENGKLNPPRYRFFCAPVRAYTRKTRYKVETTVKKLITRKCVAYSRALLLNLC